jgi:hypothetical protein
MIFSVDVPPPVGQMLTFATGSFGVTKLAAPETNGRATSFVSRPHNGGHGRRSAAATIAA